MHINSNRAIPKFFVATLISMPKRLNLGSGNFIDAILFSPKQGRKLT
jgi:hypothetical protein